MDTRRAVRRAVTGLGVLALLAASGCGFTAAEAPDGPGLPSATRRPVVWPPSPTPSPSPTRNHVVLREHAGQEDLWILDALEDGGPSGCPRPSLSNMVVLDSDGHGYAYAVWLADDVYVCAAALVRRRNGRLQETSLFAPIRELAAGHPHLFSFQENGGAYLTAFLGVDGGVALKGDETGRYWPARSRTVQLGGGRVVTFAVARFTGEFSGGRHQPFAFCPVRDVFECRAVR
ncbi:hypothetical protein ACIA8O_35520 [Kitasatospora sp. NPDC051853]|uniref:hypothetical protein n=1 Tax=Kitasatospora sp. NPDC051853 TaxID=3364058 RepID=UPI00378CF82A